MTPDLAASILGFLRLADRLKQVERHGRVVPAEGTTRRENTAEHGWNLAPVALPLHGEVSATLDLGRALAMATVVFAALIGQLHDQAEGMPG